MNNSVIVTWFMAHWLDALIVLIAIVAMFFIRYLLIKKGNWARVRSVIFRMILDAEKMYGEKTGEVKLKEVMSRFRSSFPAMSLFVSDEVLEVIITQTVAWLNKYLKEHSADLDSLENNLTRKMLAESAGADMIV